MRADALTMSLLYDYYGELLTEKQRQIWEYLRLHPDETNYSIIARGAKVTRHTVAKHYGMVREMLGFY